MFKINQISLLVVFVLMVLFACQQQTAEAPAYPEDEIPITASSDEAMKEFMAGLEILDMGNFQKSRDYFDKALEADPDFVSARIYKAFTSTSAKEFGDNCKAAMALRDKANEGEKLWMDLMNTFLTNDNLAGMEVSKKLVAAFPNSARAQEQLGFAHSALDDEEKARAQYQKAIDTNPDYLPAYNSIGTSYMFNEPKDFKKAEGFMTTMLEKSPTNSRAHIALGDCFRAQKDLDKALASYLDAATHDDTDPVAHSKAGHVNSLLGNYDDARTNYQNARERSTHGTGSINFEGFTYLYEGDHQKALSFLSDMAKKVDGMDIPDGNKTGTKMGCAFACAMIAMHHGDAAHVKEVVEMMKPLSAQIGEDIGTEEARMNTKSNMQYWDAIASAMEGNMEGARAKAEEMKVTLEPNRNPTKLRPYHFAHGFINMKEGNYAKAVEHFEQTNLDGVYNKYMLAMANEKAGNADKAVELLNDIVDNNFNNVGYALIRNELKEKLSS